MRSIILILFQIAIISLLAASVWYVTCRFSALFGMSRRKPLYLLVTVCFFGSLFASLSGAQLTSPLMGLVNIAGGYLFSFYTFVLLLLLCLHAVQKVVNVPPRPTAIAVLVAAALITTAGAFHANSFEVNRVEITLEGLEEDLLIMHMPDIHIGHHRGKDHLEKIVSETNRHKPDMVLINGDLVDSNIALQPGILSPLSELEAPAFFTNGNHDNYVDTARALEIISSHGVRVLHNEVVEIHGIYLVGLDYMNPDNNTFDMHPSNDHRTIKDILPRIPLPDDKPSVLMHHSPVGVQYVSAKGIDLMLAGHTHGGQMFPGTLLMPLFMPFNKGRYEEGDTIIYVSQGAGTFGLRVRLGTSNEIDLIRLRRP